MSAQVPSDDNNNNLDNRKLPPEEDHEDESEGEAEAAAPKAKRSRKNAVVKTREMRLEQNRKAARESRKRKKVLVEELQRSVIFFSRANGNLRGQNEEMEQMLLTAQSQLKSMEGLKQPAVAMSNPFMIGVQQGLNQAPAPPAAAPAAAAPTQQPEKSDGPAPSPNQAAVAPATQQNQQQPDQQQQQQPSMNNSFLTNWMNLAAMGGGMNPAMMAPFMQGMSAMQNGMSAMQNGMNALQNGMNTLPNMGAQGGPMGMMPFGFPGFMPQGPTSGGVGVNNPLAGMGPSPAAASSNGGSNVSATL